MRKQILKFLILMAIASPLALAGCHSDEHPGESASEHPEKTSEAKSEGSEHPEKSGGSEHPK